jgi:hypothetical protein
VNSFLLLQTGDYLLLQDGGKLIIDEEPTPPTDCFLQLQSGGLLLLQTGGRLSIVCGETPVPPVTTAAAVGSGPPTGTSRKVDDFISRDEVIRRQEADILEDDEEVLLVIQKLIEEL